MKYTGYILIVTMLLIPFSNGLAVDHSLFTSVLKKHVVNGKVNYKNLKNDKRLDRYLAVLGNVNPYGIKGKNDRLAYWINAYNAFTLKIVCDNYPVDSIKDIGSFFSSVWDKKFIRIKNKIYSLNDIEHRIIRKRFKEPRIHFALVCAARSCPSLRSEAFTGSRLNSQLQDQGVKFLRNRLVNRFVIAKKQAAVSKIFKWYRADFPKSDRKFLLYLARFTTPNVSTAIKSNPSAWSIRYLNYSWSLNKR